MKETSKRKTVAVKDKVILGLCDNAVIERSHVLIRQRISRSGICTQGVGVAARENLHRASNHFALEYLRDRTQPDRIASELLSRPWVVSLGCPWSACFDWGTMIGKATGISWVSLVTLRIGGTQGAGCTLKIDPIIGEFSGGWP